MTIDEAIERLGSLVARSGGEGDDALDVFKDTCSVASRALDFVNGEWGGTSHISNPDTSVGRLFADADRLGIDIPA